MPRFKGQTELVDEERKAFLTKCWKLGVAPDAETWRRYQRRAAEEHLQRAHQVLLNALDPEWEREDSHDEAADLLIAWLNRAGAHFRLSGCPEIPFDELDDEEVWPAWEAREEALRTMPYLDYLQTPEWAERRRGALRRAGHACETCGAQGRLHVHHRTYERRGKEWVDDLVVLCEDCHLAVHTGGGSHRPRNLA